MLCCCGVGLTTTEDKKKKVPGGQPLQMNLMKPANSQSAHLVQGTYSMLVHGVCVQGTYSMLVHGVCVYKVHTTVC